MSFSSGPSDARGTSAGDIPPADHDIAVDPNRHDMQQRPETGARSASGSASAPAKNMLPGRRRRALGVERFVMRLVATCGIVGIGVALGAILVSSNVQGWITGLVVSLVSVILAAILWSSRQL